MEAERDPANGVMRRGGKRRAWARVELTHIHNIVYAYEVVASVKQVGAVSYHTSPVRPKAPGNRRY